MRKLLLIIMLLSLIFSACANNDAEPDNGKPYLAETDDAVIGETTTEENRILPNLSADTNFNGYTFNVLIRDTGDEWTPRDVFAEKENGDLINDAVYRRNRVIEEKYNFKIEQKVVFEYIGNPITKAVASGDNEFDIAYPFLCDVPDLAQKGYFVDLLRVPNLDLTRLWWDAKATAALSVGGKLYFTAGDLMLMNFDACPGILFNKTLLDDNNLQNPYDLVDKNEWTINKLYEMSRAAPKDLNGDGAMTYDADCFGFIGQRDALTSFLHGADEIICGKDADDYPVIKFGSERAYKAMEECFRLMYDQNITHNAHHIEGKVPNIYTVSEDMFMDQRALFMWVRLRIVEKLRGMETDFGILPMPKLESSQTNWGHTVNKYVGAGLVVPMTADNLERTGFILEAIAAESMYTTVKAYYDVALKTKFARDNESSEMLDIIFASTVYDTGEIYNFGTFGRDLIWMSMTNDTNLASLFGKAEPKMEKEIDNVIKKYGDLD